MRVRHRRAIVGRLAARCQRPTSCFADEQRILTVPTLLPRAFQLSMKVLVIGSGGREHALCWKIRQSPLVTKLHCAPGKPGTASLADNVDIAAGDIAGLVRFAVAEKIDLTVVGPEAPLCAGIVDEFGKHKRLCFGPSKAAAELEGSKAFAREVCRRHRIPGPDYWTFDDLQQA